MHKYSFVLDGEMNPHTTRNLIKHISNKAMLGKTSELHHLQKKYNKLSEKNLNLPSMS